MHSHRCRQMIINKRLLQIGMIVFLGGITFLSQNAHTIKAADIPTHVVCDNYEGYDPSAQSTQKLTATSTPTIKPTLKPTATPKPKYPYASRLNPALLCDQFYWTYGDGSQLYTAIKEYFRGDEASSMIKGSLFGTAPDKGNEYLNVYYHVWYADSPKEAVDRKLIFTAFDFSSVSKGRVYNSHLSQASPEFGGEIFAGGDIEGWVTIQVRIGDEHPLLVFERLGSFEERAEAYILLN